MNPLQSAAFELIRSQIIKYIVSQAPILSSALLNPILGFIVNYVLKVAFEQTELAIYFIKVDNLTKKQAEEFKKSQDNLKNAKTDEEKKKATDELKNNLRDLIGFNK